tara:strand:- start:6609 stop:6710 length:102 start_codon:yes stop_codon:yes gene_type:complete
MLSVEVKIEAVVHDFPYNKNRVVKQNEYKDFIQ